MLDDFMIRAALAGIGTALAAGPLGCFVVWRRMAYFGDATAHAAMLGVALALAMQVPVLGGVLVTALGMGLTVSALSGRGFATDTLLGVLAHSALAFGLVAVSFLSGVRVDLMGYLFGDILAVGWTDVATIWTGGLAVLLLITSRWSALLTTTINPDLAIASGLDARRERMVLTLALALAIAIAMNVVGVLLISALLVIPAASARSFAQSPEAMAVMAVVIGAVSSLGGLALSFTADTPAGPSIVCVAAVLFGLSLAAKGRRIG